MPVILAYTHLESCHVPALTRSRMMCRIRQHLFIFICSRISWNHYGAKGNKIHFNKFSVAKFSLYDSVAWTSYFLNGSGPTLRFRHYIWGLERSFPSTLPNADLRHCRYHNHIPKMPGLRGFYSFPSRSRNYIKTAQYFAKNKPKQKQSFAKQMGY